jgi:hypothetical protein
MAGIEPTPSKSNDWTPLSPCQLGQRGCLTFSPIVQWGGFGLARQRVDQQQHRKGGLGAGVPDPITGVVCWAGVLSASDRQ